ncbi:MAG: hypothetical protein RMY34_17280 [Aulosira sp. DedQUE10]|nr:hypothetical protein [Aulosira sp. DedQUE10]
MAIAFLFQVAFASPNSSPSHFDSYLLNVSLIAPFPQVFATKAWSI